MMISNMIEEKRLKKGFIIATLISTIAGTFTTGINLYDRVKEKRQQEDKKEQDKTNHGQDEKIKELEKRVNEVDEGRKVRDIKNELRQSLAYGGPLIQREYDRDYARLGPRFAEGDLIAETQLQSQVITLQGTVIKLLEEAIYTGRMPDVKKLYNASEFAREGSIRALQDQYQRLLQAAPLRRPGLPVRRISSSPTLEHHPAELSFHSQAMVPYGRSGSLFCRYAEELQRTGRPLDAAFAPGGSRGCPCCGMFIDIEAGRSWKVSKEVVRRHVSRTSRRDEEIIETAEDRTYLLSNRFLVKCHRDGAGYACYLCSRHRDRDTLCQTMESFVTHVWKKHDIREYEDEPDIRDVTHRERLHA